MCPIISVMRIETYLLLREIRASLSSYLSLMVIHVDYIELMYFYAL